MSKAESSGPIRFKTEILNEATEILRSAALPERLALLPELLCAWAIDALPDHLTRDDRAVHSQRTAQCNVVSDLAERLRREVEALNELGRFDECLSSLRDLRDELRVSAPKPQPYRLMRSYLVVLDLAAIFDFVTGTRPTRHNKHYSENGKQKPSGPFWGFVNCVCKSVPEVKSLDRAAKRVLAHYYDAEPKDPDKHGYEDSEWFHNLQFSHPLLWAKMRRVP